MKLLPPLLILILTATSALTGCQSPKAMPPAAEDGAARAKRNNCYGLLHQLLDEQKDVSTLRFIKKEHSDVKELVKRIATASGAGSKLLEEFARQDSSIDLNDIRLPPGETAVRAAISSSKEKELLGHTGKDFELALLLTQSEALNYAWHLAMVAGENESQPERARALAALSGDMQNLYRETFSLLASKTISSGTKQ
jgi:hypothetical protein